MLDGTLRDHHSEGPAATGAARACAGRVIASAGRPAGIFHENGAI